MGKKKTEPKQLIYSYEGNPKVPPPGFPGGPSSILSDLISSKSGVTAFYAACVSRKKNSSREKVIVRVPFKNFSGSEPGQIWELPHLQYLCIVDTNTKATDGVLQSRTNFQVLRNVGGGRFELFADYDDSFATIPALDRLGIDLSQKKAYPLNTEIWGPLAEKLGICRTIERLLTTFGQSPVGIVWDSDLGNHDSINYEEKQILEGTPMTLPKTYSIIYASSDNKNAHVLCELLANSDRKAKT